jgi:hypothetical protein
LVGEDDDEVEKDDGFPNLKRFCFGSPELVELGEDLDLCVVEGMDNVWVGGVVGTLVGALGSTFSSEDLNSSGYSVARSFVNSVEISLISSWERSVNSLERSSVFVMSISPNNRSVISKDYQRSVKIM